MPSFPPIVVRQPRPEDIVDDPILVAGIGAAFEGTLQTRVRDAAGNELASGFISTGFGVGWANFTAEVRVGAVPPTTRGSLEVYEQSAEDGSEIDTVSVPVVFGRALVDPYSGFGQRTVVAGDTLSSIAGAEYGDPGLFGRIFEANRDQLDDPDLIRPGQVLRIPR